MKIKLKSKKAMSGVGFEPTPPFGDQNARSHCVMGRYLNLESGALDRSAILTSTVRKPKICLYLHNEINATQWNKCD